MNMKTRVENRVDGMVVASRNRGYKQRMELCAFTGDAERAEIPGSEAGEEVGIVKGGHWRKGCELPPKEEILISCLPFCICSINPWDGLTVFLRTVSMIGHCVIRL